MNISDVTISTSNPITANAGESLTLECSTIIVDGLPENLIAPVFDWLFDREEVSLLDPTTMHMAVMKNNSNNTYFMISTLQFSALSQFHAGMYTCRFGRNPRLEANTTVIIGGTIYHACMIITSIYFLFSLQLQILWFVSVPALTQLLW